MYRGHLIFISLIGLATLSLGLLWGQVQSLVAAPIPVGKVALMVLYGWLLSFAWLALGRMLVRLAPVASTRDPGEHQEVER